MASIVETADLPGPAAARDKGWVRTWGLLAMLVLAMFLAGRTARYFGIPRGYSHLLFLAGVSARLGPGVRLIVLDNSYVPGSNHPVSRTTEAGEGWRSITYGEAHDTVRRLAASLADLGLGPDRPLLILARNSIDHALVAYGAACGG